jgi:pyrimidine-nucleoside phosphorylase
VIESIEALKGDGPHDLMRITFALGAEMLYLANKVSKPADAWAMMRDAIDSGRALEKFGEIIEAQGGDRKVIDDPTRLPMAAVRGDYVAPKDGYVERVSPRVVGHGIIALGGGRRTMDDDIDPSVGFVITVKPGDNVQKGEKIATIHARDDQHLAAGRAALAEAIEIGDSVIPPLELISHRMSTRGRDKWKGPSQSVPLSQIDNEIDSDEDVVILPPPA